MPRKDTKKRYEVHPKLLRKADVPWVRKGLVSPTPRLSLIEDMAQHRHVQSSLRTSLWWESQAHLDRPVHSCVAGITGVSSMLLSTYHMPWGIFQPNTQPNSPSSILGKALTAFTLSLTWTTCHWVHQSDLHVLLYPWRGKSGLQSLSWRWISLWRHLLTTEGVQDDEIQGRCSHAHGPCCASHLRGQQPELHQYLMARGGEQG